MKTPTPQDWQNWMNYQSNKDRVIAGMERAEAGLLEDEFCPDCGKPLEKCNCLG